MPFPSTSISRTLFNLTPNFETAHNSGALYFIESFVRTIEGEGGRNFQPRVCSALQNRRVYAQAVKAELRSKGIESDLEDNSHEKRLPFDPPYVEDLHVRASDTRHRRRPAATGIKAGLCVQLNAQNASRPRGLHTSIRTVINPTIEAVKQDLKAHPAAADSVALFLLHPELPRDLAEAILSLVQEDFPSAIGSYAVSGHNNKAADEMMRSEPPLSFSIATFTRSSSQEHIWTFRADIPSRPPVSVGKAIRSRPLTKPGYGGENHDEQERLFEGRGENVGLGAVLAEMTDRGPGGWGDLWENGFVEGSAGRLGDLPAEMAHLKNVDSMLLLSDGNPATLLTALSDHMPSPSILGLLTAPTPFLTGRPFTLIRNGVTFEDGAVGLAFSGCGAGMPKVERTWADSEALGPIERVLDCEGNMLISLASDTASNPAQALIKAINLAALSSGGPRPNEGKTAAAGISLGKMSKELEFYVAFLEEGNETPYQIVRITSGDPARGALCLDMQESIRPGQIIQFVRKAPNSTQSPTWTRSNAISFNSISADEDSPFEATPSTLAQSETIKGISIGTESGFFFSAGAKSEIRGGKAGRASVWKIPGAKGAMSF